LATLPSEAIHTLQDGLIVKLQAQEQCALNIISEQKVENAQLLVHKNFSIDILKATMENNEHMTKVVAKACRTIP